MTYSTLTLTSYSPGSATHVTVPLARGGTITLCFTRIFLYTVPYTFTPSPNPCHLSYSILTLTSYSPGSATHVTVPLARGGTITLCFTRIFSYTVPYTFTPSPNPCHLSYSILTLTSYSPGSATHVTVPLARGGTITLCFTRIFSYTVPYTSPPVRWLPTCNEHYVISL